jgi:hypothetical protein
MALAILAARIAQNRQLETVGILPGIYKQVSKLIGLEGVG